MRVEGKKSILLVDDDENILSFVQDALEDAGHAVMTATDGERALVIARRKNPDLVILDIMMPKYDGYTVCRTLREELEVPLLLLSAKQTSVDRVLGFSMGADDYIVKPFSIQELVARIDAHLRREQRAQSKRGVSTALTFGELTVDVGEHEVRYRGEAVPMTRKEFDLLKLLALHPRQVFYREQVYEQVWDLEATACLSTVTEHVKRIRRKLATVDPGTDYIATIWGVGYKWTLTAA